MTNLIEILLSFVFMYPIIFAVMLMLDVLGAWVVLRNCLSYCHKYRRRPCGDTPPVADHDHRPPVIDLAEVERVRRGLPRCRTLALLRVGAGRNRPELACVCEDIRRGRMICMCRNLRGTVSSML